MDGAGADREEFQVAGGERELKTPTCDRSYPTLRGHLPALEVGRESSVPDGIDPSAPSIRLEVPRRLDGVLSVVPLAYYLGPGRAGGPAGAVVHGEDHRLRPPSARSRRRRSGTPNGGGGILDGLTCVDTRDGPRHSRPGITAPRDRSGRSVACAWD